MKRSKRKLNVLKLIIFIFCILFLIIIFKLLLGIKKNSTSHEMINVVNKNITEANELLSKYKMDINTTYKYDSDYDKDTVISQSIDVGKIVNDGDKLDLVVSLGKIDKEKLKKDGINELGKVPIMMYHGIEDKLDSDTKYTGGNVDKDGYNRTVESFRKDLEFYYNKGYRMVKLSDYINGKIDVEYGYSPIVITFDDGKENNIRVTGLDSDGNIIIDKNSAVGVLEEFKKKYPDYNVTAIFFVNQGLFSQPEYNEKILKWLIDNNYEVGNHTKNHDNFSKIDSNKTQEVVGYMYSYLDSIIGDKYSKIVALPFGSPYNKGHANYKFILNGTYDGKEYQTEAALRVGWEPEVSPFNKEFDKTFLKRCRAYDNNGKDFDIAYVFKNLEKNRYISDGDKEKIVIKKSDNTKINDVYTNVITYEE